MLVTRLPSRRSARSNSSISGAAASTMAMIVRGFIEPIAKELPLEYAVELNRLIEMEMEGSVG